VTMNAASESLCFSALARRSSISSSPEARTLTATTFNPAMTADYKGRTEASQGKLISFQHSKREERESRKNERRGWFHEPRRERGRYLGDPGRSTRGRP
jgi:hypothetical protein